MLRCFLLDGRGWKTALGTLPFRRGTRSGGFRALASSKLKYKPNGVAASADANGRALVCVATCADDGAVAVFEL